MTAWELIQVRVPFADVGKTELDELEQLADEVKSVPFAYQLSGRTPDGDDWSVIVESKHADHVEQEVDEMFRD